MDQRTDPIAVTKHNYNRIKHFSFFCLHIKRKKCVYVCVYGGKLLWPPSHSHSIQEVEDDDNNKDRTVRKQLQLLQMFVDSTNVRSFVWLGKSKVKHSISIYSFFPVDHRLKWNRNRNSAHDDDHNHYWDADEDDLCIHWSRHCRIWKNQVWNIDRVSEPQIMLVQKPQ